MRSYLCQRFCKIFLVWQTFISGIISLYPLLYSWDRFPKSWQILNFLTTLGLPCFSKCPNAFCVFLCGASLTSVSFGSFWAGSISFFVILHLIWPKIPKRFPRMLSPSSIIDIYFQLFAKRAKCAKCKVKSVKCKVQSVQSANCEWEIPFKGRG